MSINELRGRSTIEAEAIEAEAKAARKKHEAEVLELENLRKLSKGHIENVLGACNDYAKGIINAMPKALLNVVKDMDETGLHDLFGQKAINVSFCNVRKIADKETRKEARTIDLAARVESKKAYKKAEIELFQAFNKLTEKIKPSANKALGLMVEGIKAWPEDVDGKSMSFLKETVRQGDYVLTFSAATRYKPEKVK